MTRLQSLSISIAIPALLLSGIELVADFGLLIVQPAGFVHTDVIIVAISGALLGPVAILGICLGLVVGIAINGLSILHVLTLLLVGGWCSLLSPLQYNQTRTTAVQPLAEFLRSYIATATGAVLFQTAVLSWISVINGTGQFHPSNFVMMGSIFVSTVVLGGSIVTVSYPLLRREGVRSILTMPSDHISDRVPRGRMYNRYIIAPIIIWLVVGGGVALFFDVLELIPRFAFHRRGLGYLLVLKDISDLTNDGAVIQILLGGVTLGFLSVVCLRSSTSG